LRTGRRAISWRMERSEGNTGVTGWDAILYLKALFWFCHSVATIKRTILPANYRRNLRTKERETRVPVCGVAGDRAVYATVEARQWRFAIGNSGGMWPWRHGERGGGEMKSGKLAVPAINWSFWFSFCGRQRHVPDGHCDLSLTLPMFSSRPYGNLWIASSVHGPTYLPISDKLSFASRHPFSPYRAPVSMFVCMAACAWRLYPGFYKRK